MKIIIVGGTGAIGKGIVNELKDKHSLIIAGHSQGDIKVDITSPESIANLYRTVENFDALICAAGNVHFGDFNEMTMKEHLIGINSKLLGQMLLVHMGLKYINDFGSFTLTSGSLSHDPIRYGCSASMVNSGIEGFVKGAAIEMKHGLRINAVSPTLLTESIPEFGDYFPGTETVTAARVALAYRKSVDGAQTGQIYQVR